MYVKERVYRELENLELEGADLEGEKFEEEIGLPRQDILDHEVNIMYNSELERLLAEFGIQRAIDLYVDEYGYDAMCVKNLLYNALETELHSITTHEDFEQWKQSRTRNE
jgi:hypothetical protein